MAEFTFTDDSGKVFSLKGPEGLTPEQAAAIFKQQSETGSLVGLKPGDSLSAATQAAGGLAAAQSMLQQAQGGLSGALAKFGSVNPTGSISKDLGAAGGALSGFLSSSAAGLTAALGPAVKNDLTVVQGATATSSIQTVNNLISRFPLDNPISIADFVKTASSATPGGAVAPIGSMNMSEVNGVLAQAQNIVGQSSDTLSNSKGLGSFGLSLKQLETAGFVKPGTAALATKVGSSFTQMINSPSVWTGKDGVAGATDLLANPGKQSQIQQDLMTKGVAGLAAIGVPMKDLSSQGTAGLSLIAAKGLPNAEAFIKGLPIPGDATGNLKAAFSTAIRDGAYAVNMVKDKIPTVFKEQDVPVAKSDTVNRDAVDAASARVIGNDKVPEPNYGPPDPVDYNAIGQEYVTKSTTLINEYINPAGRGFETVNQKLSTLENQQTITQQAYDAINNEFQTIRQNYNLKGPALASEIIALYDRLGPTQQKLVDTFPNSPTKITNLVTYLLNQSKQLKERLYQLSLKIIGRGEGE